MKYIIIILLITTSFSCDRTVKSDVKVSAADTLQLVDLTLNSPKTDKVVGEWTIWVTGSGNSSIHCNVCPKVNFNADGTLGNGLSRWKVVDKKLILTGGGPDGLFPDGEYEMFYEPESNFEKLTLTQVENKYWYKLGRN